MSYFSDKEYKRKDGREELWFDELYFNRWFKDMKGPILDVGCATGNFIAVKPEVMEGVDIDDDSIAIARERGFKVEKVEADKPMTVLKDNAYEGVYVKHVIEHLREPLLFFKEIKRILKPGGKAVLLTPNCPYALTRMFYDDYTHQRPFTKNSLNMICYDAGFAKVKIYEDFRCFPGLGRIMRTFGIRPDTVRRIEDFLFVRGLALIVEITKE